MSSDFISADPGELPFRTASAALQVGAPGFEPGTSASRTQRSTGLSHAPGVHLLKRTEWDGPRFARSPRLRLGSNPLRVFLRNPRGFSPTNLPVSIKRTEWDSNPRGLSPTRFPIVRLKPLGHPSKGPARRGGTRRPYYTSTEGVGFEPTRAFRPNALAGRRLKPLGHPSKDTPSSPRRPRPIAPLGLEPRLFGARIRRVASYTTGQKQSHLSESNRRPRHYE